MPFAEAPERHQAQELVGLYSRDTKHPDSYRAFSYPNYVDIRDNNPVFSSLLAHNLAMVGVKEGDNTRASVCRHRLLQLLFNAGCSTPRRAGPLASMTKSRAAS